MINSIKQKNKYSGISSIGNIPNNWELRKLKYITPSNSYYPIGDGDHGAIKPEMYQKEGVPYFRVQNLTWNGEVNYDGMVFISEKVHRSNPKSVLYPNDILIAKTGATIGKLCIIPKEIREANTTSSVGKITVDRENYSVRFVLYSMMSKCFQNQYELDAYEKSAQPGFNIDDLINYYIAIPSLQNQTKIANYLDTKTEQIKKFIDNKKTLITLLEEQRKTTIYNLVTKGLDLSVETKPSNIEWIGNIPKDWTVRRLKMLSRIIRGASPRPIDDPKYFDEDGEFSWVRISDVTASNLYLEKTEQKLSELGASLSVKQFPDDLFLSIAGSVGKPIITKIKCCIHDGFVSFSKISNELDKMFLFYILYSGEAYSGLGKEGTQLNLNIDTVGNIYTPLPPLLVQKKIVKKIEEDLSKIDRAIHTVQQEIELIEEYQKSLIYQAVTGKIETLLTNK